MNNKQSIQVAIADDHILVRDCICDMISAQPEFDVTIRAGNGLELVEQLARSENLPDVCILDVQMPGMNGYEAAKQIRAQWPGVKLLVLSMLDDEFVVSSMLTLGVNGYMVKGCTMDELFDALSAVHTQGSYYPNWVKEKIGRRKGARQTHVEINEGELSFLKYCHTEMSIKEIARKMAVSAETVHGYMRSLFHKLNLHTRHGLALFAVKSGLVSIREAQPYAGN